MRFAFCQLFWYCLPNSSGTLLVLERLDCTDCQRQLRQSARGDRDRLALFALRLVLNQLQIWPRQQNSIQKLAAFDRVLHDAPL